MASLNLQAIEINRNSFRALRDDVIVEDMEFGERKLSSGIIMLSDDGKGYGIRPRWAKYGQLVQRMKMYLSANGFA